MNTILAITYSFFLSYVPMYDIGFNKYSETYDNSTHVEFIIGMDVLDMLYFYSGEETYQIPCTFFDWQPYRQSYLLGTELHKKFDSFEIKGGIKHKCLHPINSWNNQISTSNESFTEVYINISGKFNIF